MALLFCAVLCNLLKENSSPLFIDRKNFIFV